MSHREHSKSRSPRVKLAALAFTALLCALVALAARAAADTSFGEAQSPQAGHLTDPIGVGVDPQSGDVYVANGFKHTVAKFDETGSSLFAFGWGVANGAEEEQTCTLTCHPSSSTEAPASVTGGALALAGALAVDPTAGEHDLYVADPNFKRVEKFKPGGEFLLSFGGDVVASGPDNSTTDETQKLTVAAEGGTFKLRFEYPWSQAYSGSTVDPATASLKFNAGAAEVEHALDQLSTVNGAYVSGGEVKVSGGPGDAGGSHPYEITFEGNLSGDDVPQLTVVNELTGATHTATVQTPANGGGPEVCKPSAGDVCKQGGDLGSGLDGTFSPWPAEAGVLAVDPTSGDLYVGDTDRVQKFSPAGAYLSKLELPGAGPTEALAVGSTGDLYVISEDVSGVQVFEPSGTPLPTLTPPGRLTTLAADASGDVFVGTELHHGEPEVAYEFFAYNLAGVNYAQFTSSLLEPEAEHHEYIVAGSAVASATKQLYVTNVYREGGEFVAHVVVTHLPEPGPPLVKQESSSDVEPTTATLNATVNPGGFETTYRFQYTDQHSFETEGGFEHCGQPANPHCQQTSPGTLPAPIHDDSVSAAASNLTPETAYRFRAVAESECEPLLHPGEKSCVAEGVRDESGQEVPESFETLPPVSVRDFTTQTVAPEEVVLTAELNNNNSLTPGHWKICYGTEPGPAEPGHHAAGCAEGTLPAGSGTFEPIEATFTGLAPNTPYHYQLVAENGYTVGGVEPVRTPDQTLTTEETLAEENAAAACPNQLRREENSSLALPDCRAYEQVSPAYKAGYAVQTGIQDTGLAPSGERLSFATFGSFAGESGQIWYVAHRTPSGWVTQPALGRPAGPEYQPRALSEFSAELDTSLFHLAPASTAVEAEEGEQSNLYYFGRDGSFLQATPTISIQSGAYASQWDNPIAQSTDLSRLFLGSSYRLLPPTEDPLPDHGGIEINRIYEVSGAGGPSPSMRLVAEVAEHLSDIGGCALDTQFGQQLNSSSADGSTLFYDAPLELQPGAACDETVATDRPNKDALFACDTEAGPCVEGLPGYHAPLQLSAESPTQCTSGHPCHGAPAADAHFYGASPDGTRAWFTTTQPLVDSDRDTGEGGAANDLYLAKLSESGGLESLLQASEGNATDPNRGEAAGVQGVLGVSADGLRAAFVARGVLTTEPNSAGYPTLAHETAAQGADNLYLYDAASGETKFVARLCSGPAESGTLTDPACDAGLSSGNGGPGTRNDRYLWHTGEADLAEEHLTPDGRFLLFKSFARLTPDDTDAAADIYRYDFATGRLIRVSFGRRGNAADGNDGLDALIGQQGVNGRLDEAAENPDRSISAGGSTVVFRTAEPLVSRDTDAAANPGCENHQTGCDVYEWEEDGHGTCREAGGCVSLISSGTDPHLVEAPVISSSGRDIAFTTPQGLVPADTDGNRDFYDARVEGGFPYTPPETPCGGAENCHGQGTSEQIHPAYTTEEIHTGGNGPRQLNCAKGKHKVKKHGQLRCVPNHRKKHHKKSSHHKHAKRQSAHRRAARPNRGGGK